MTNNTISLAPLAPVLEAALDCQKKISPWAHQSYLQWLRKPDAKILEDAWKLLGEGTDSILSFAEKIRKGLLR